MLGSAPWTAGCTDTLDTGRKGLLEKVKESYMPLDDSRTLAEAAAAYSGFALVSWEAAAEPDGTIVYRLKGEYAPMQEQGFSVLDVKGEPESLSCVFEFLRGEDGPPVPRRLVLRVGLADGGTRVRTIEKAGQVEEYLVRVYEDRPLFSG
jgi:hypothetical protein